MSYTSHYGEKNSGSAYEKNFGLAYETEYLLAGKAKDIDNLKAVAGQILAIRGGANLIALMQDEGKNNMYRYWRFPWHPYWEYRKQRKYWKNC